MIIACLVCFLFVCVFKNVSCKECKVVIVKRRCGIKLKDTCVASGLIDLGVNAYNIDDLCERMRASGIQSAYTSSWDGASGELVLQSKGTVNPFDPKVNDTNHVLCLFPTEDKSCRKSEEIKAWRRKSRPRREHTNKLMQADREICRPSKIGKLRCKIKDSCDNWPPGRKITWPWNERALRSRKKKDVSRMLEDCQKYQSDTDHRQS